MAPQGLLLYASFGTRHHKLLSDAAHQSYRPAHEQPQTKTMSSEPRSAIPLSHEMEHLVPSWRNAVLRSLQTSHTNKHGWVRDAQKGPVVRTPPQSDPTDAGRVQER